MFVLFSPSEGKCVGGLTPFKETRHELLANQESVRTLVSLYEETLQSGTLEQKQALTGWKKEEQIDALPKHLSLAPTLPTLKRYTGVGFEYLDVASLSPSEYTYLESHVLIFSHLFGPLRGSDRIPETKLKQCRTFHGVNIPKLFSEETSDVLHELIGDEPVLDLRAKYYQDYFTPRTHTTECIFLKEGKVVNHWSKAYRGQLLRMVAQHQPKDVDALLERKIPGWTLVSSVEEAGRHVLTFDVER